MRELLARYPDVASTRDEAFADVLGSLGVLSTGLVNSSELCMHVSQTWCARTQTGSGDALGVASPTHPPPNRRGDSLCATMRDMHA